MKNNKYDLVDIASDVSKIGYSVISFTCKYIYKVSNLEALKNSMDSFMLSRFSQRLEYFTFEHNKLTKLEKKDFYHNLDNNKQNINYLYEFIERARVSTFEIQAKLLARLSVELVRNNKLSYQEQTILDIINSFNDIDFLNLYKDTNFSKNPTLEYYYGGLYLYNTNESYLTFQKSIRLGLFDKLNKENFHLSVIDDISNITNNTNSTNYEKIVSSPLTGTFFHILNDVMNDTEN